MKKIARIMLAAIILIVVMMASVAMAATSEPALESDPVAARITPFWLAVIIVAAVVVVLLAMGVIIPWAINKGINLSALIQGASTALKKADLAVEGFQAIMPDNPGLALADKIIEYAMEGVEAAEQMYKSHQIDDSERKDEAFNLALLLLGIADVDITDDVRKAVRGCVESGVHILPKTGVITPATAE